MAWSMSSQSFCNSMTCAGFMRRVALRTAKLSMAMRTS